MATRLDTDTHPCPDEHTSEPEASIWRSQGGTLYLFDGDAFTCIAVHDVQFEGWVGKRAVKSVWRIGAVGGGLQAFRQPQTGVLGEWVPIDLRFGRDLITKTFPSDRFHGFLVYGSVEQYFRSHIRHPP